MYCSGLIEPLANRTGSRKAGADRLNGRAIEINNTILKKGGNAALTGSDVFEIRKRSICNGRNPSTGAATMIEVQKAPVFNAVAMQKTAISGLKR